MPYYHIDTIKEKNIDNLKAALKFFIRSFEFSNTIPLTQKKLYVTLFVYY